MTLARILISLFLLPQNADFGAKFVSDLQTLFGRLETSELDTAFQRAKAIRCSDLIGKSGEWKVVGFLNDNRALAAWHHEDIDTVKNDPVRYVFSGRCTNDQFDPAAWMGRIGKPQRIESCAWQPVSSGQAERLLTTESEVLYTLGFRKDASSGISVTFDVDSAAGGRIGMLQCSFPKSQTPADVTVGQWNSIVGPVIVIEVRP